MPSTVTAKPQAVVPALDIDKCLYRDNNGRPSPNGVLERRIVANLIDHLKRAGFHLRCVDDGESRTNVTTPKQAMELVFNLDEVNVGFYKTHPAHVHFVFLVLGNGIDIISDWGYTKGDADGFNAALEAFNAEDYA